MINTLKEIGIILRTHGKESNPLFLWKMLAKLNHYGIHGVSNDRFKSYLSNRNQYVSINGYECGLATLNRGVPQGSVLRALLFILYINDLNQAIKFCKVHHFAGDTNLLCLSNSIKKLNKLIW